MDILCVLKSGGVYDASWVEKLKRGVDRHLKGHRFYCLSDADVPCRIPLEHGWEKWWSKIELFKPGLIKGPTLYLDLDTIITGPLDEFTNLPYDFAMLRNFNDGEMVGSGVMWFKEKAPEGVYERFIESPDRIMEHYHNIRMGPYRGDQAFIWDTLERSVDSLAIPSLKSYKKHCLGGLPQGTSIVCFHGRPRPSEIGAKWMDEHWV